MRKIHFIHTKQTKKRQRQTKKRQQHKKRRITNRKGGSSILPLPYPNFLSGNSYEYVSKAVGGKKSSSLSNETDFSFGWSDREREDPYKFTVPRLNRNRKTEKRKRGSSEAEAKTEVRKRRNKSVISTTEKDMYH